MIENGIVLIDGNLKRRAEIGHLLRAKGFHIEPYETVADYEEYPLQAALYLIADDANELGVLVNTLAHVDHFPKIIGYRADPSVDDIVEAMKTGAANYLAWPFEADEFEQTLEKIEVRGTNVAMIRSRVLRAKRKLQCLTERELQVLDLIAEGQSSKEIAQDLEISPRTVDIHRANMMVKLKSKNAAQLVRVAVEGTFAQDAPGTLPEAA